MHDMPVELLRTCQHSFGSEDCHRLSCRPCKPCFSKFLRSPLGTSHSSTAMSHQPRCSTRLVPLMRSAPGPGPPRQGPEAPLCQSMLAAPILRPLLRLREELSQSLGILLSETAGLRLHMCQGAWEASLLSNAPARAQTSAKAQRVQHILVYSPP